MTREFLPNRRESETVKFRHSGRNAYVTFSQFSDGRPAEVFLDSGKAGSELKIACIEAAIAVSFALQFGAPLGLLFDAMPRLDDGEPAGPLGAALNAIGRPIAGEVKFGG